MASETETKTKTKKPIVKYCEPGAVASSCPPASDEQIRLVCGTNSTAKDGEGEPKPKGDGEGEPKGDGKGDGKDGTNKPAPPDGDAAAEKLKEKLQAIYDFHTMMIAKEPDGDDAAAKLETIKGMWKGNTKFSEAVKKDGFEGYFNEGPTADAGFKWTAAEIPVTDNFKTEFKSLKDAAGVPQNLKDFYNKKNPPKGGRRRRRGGTKRRRKSKRRKSKRRKKSKKARKSKRRKSKRRKKSKKRRKSKRRR